MCNYPVFEPEVSGVFYMDIIYEIRRRHLVQKQTITAIAREMGISRPTVRKHLNTVEEPKYERVEPVDPSRAMLETCV